MEIYYLKVKLFKKRFKTIINLIKIYFKLFINLDIQILKSSLKIKICLISNIYLKLKIKFTDVKASISMNKQMIYVIAWSYLLLKN